MFIMSLLAMIATQNVDYKSTNVVVPENTKPCVAKYVSAEKSKELIRKLRRQGYLITVNKKVVSEGIPSGKPSLRRGYIAESGC